MTMHGGKEFLYDGYSWQNTMLLCEWNSFLWDVNLDYIKASYVRVYHIDQYEIILLKEKN